LKPLAEITELQIQELYNSLLEGGTVTAKTVRNLHKVLEPAFERAVRWKLIKENPCIDLEIPSGTGRNRDTSRRSKRSLC